MDFSSDGLVSYKENQRNLQSSFKPTAQQLALGYAGIIDLELTNYGLDEAGLELGLYFFFMVLCMYALLYKTQGDPTEIKSYLAFRKLEIFQSQAVNTPRVQTILLMGGFVYFVYPFVALFVWFIVNIIDRVALRQSVIPAISIILLGLSYTLFVQNHMMAQLNQFRFSPISLVYALLAVIFLTIYQGLVIFGYDEDPKFLPYSSFFLIFNFIVLSIMVFFDRFSDSKDILIIMQTNFPKTGATINFKRENILSEEIESQRANPKWICSFEDLVDVISLCQVSFKTFQGMIGGSIVQIFNQKSELFRNVIKYSLLFLAAAILAVYAFILYRFDDYNKTGIIVAIAVTFLDIWTFFLVVSKVIDYTIYIIIFLLLNRVLVIGPGEWYWVYGIIILYLVYSIFFTYEIARKRFPSDDDIIKRKRTMQEIMKADNSQKQELLKEKICQPELLFLIVNVAYIGLLFAVQFVDWKGKKIQPFIVNKGYNYAKVLGTGYLALLTAGIALSVFLLIAFLRIVQRKRTKTEKTSDYSEFFAQAFEKAPRLKFCYRKCDQLVIFSFLIFLFSIGWMIISWWLMRDLSVFVWGICLPIMVLSYIRGLVYFQLNDYQIFQDVETLNSSIDKHNKQIKEYELKGQEIKKKLADGTLFQVENRRSTLYKKTQQELDKIDTVSLDDTDSVKNLRLLKLIEKEEQRKKAEQEERLKKIQDNEQLRKQDEDEKIKMKRQITLEKERKETIKLKKEKQEKETELVQKKHTQFNDQLDEELVMPSQTLQPQVKNFQGNIQVGEKIQKVTPNRDDEIYEGGGPLISDTMDKSSLLQSNSDKQSLINPERRQDQEEPIELDKFYIDLDEAEEEHGGYQKIAVSRLKRVTNWRVLHDNRWYKAFFVGDLRPNDYAFIHSLFWAFAAWACLLGGLLGTTGGALGAVITVPMAYLGISYILAASVLYQSRVFTWKELIFWIILTVIYFGLSLAYFFVKFQVKNFKFTLNQRPQEQMDATYFLFFYVLCVPTSIHMIVCVIRIFERGFEGFLENFKYFIGVVILGLLLIAISCFLFVSAVQGAIFIASLMLVMFIVAQIFMYIQNGFAMTPFWFYFNGAIAFVMAFAPFVASFFTNTLTLYQGISMSTAIIVGILWIYAIAHFLQDFYEIKQRPIYFSQSLYPIYKFNDKTKDIELYYRPFACWMIGLVILMMWSLLTNTQASPRWFGAFLTIVIEAVTILTTIQANVLSIGKINEVFKQINEKICKSAWLYTKECYYKQMGALSASNLLSYRRLWKQRYFVKQYGRCLEGRELIILPKDINSEFTNELTPPQGTTDYKSYFRSKIEEFYGTEKINYQDIHDIFALRILLQGRLEDSLLEEFKLIIRFVMVAASNSSDEKEAEIKEFFRFLNEKMDILLILGLRINIPKTGTLNNQYLNVMSQIENFDEEGLDVFRQVQKLSQDEAKLRQELQEAANESKRKEQEERDKIQAELQRKRKEDFLKLENQQSKLFTDGATTDAQIDINADIDKMPDCRYKYQIIVKKAKQLKEKFVDKQFVAGDEALGQQTLMNCLSNAPTRKWIRVSENKFENKTTYSIFKNGASYDDVEQGMLGDCYFISSLAVLGNQNTKNLFVFLNSEDEFNVCGAFCIKFQVGGHETIIIIDDLFCVVNDEFPFAKSPGGELWPMIIEKAYAKLYGNYDSLKGGQMQNCLSELVQGCPKYIKHKDQPENQIWADLIKYCKLGYPLGAGSPSHPDGDSHINEEGIAQGHAYSILKAVEADGHKLLCIRNPWRHTEWNGDWSDNSEKWNTRIKNLVGFVGPNEDGIFWMDFNDYLNQFECAYACIMLSKEQGWNSLSVKDQWVGKYGEGLPRQDKRSAKLENSPQFSFKITKPGKAYLIYRLKDKLDNSRSILYGYLSVQDNNGKLIDSVDKKKTIGSVGPKNSTYQDLELNFPANLTYPMTYTIIASFQPNKDQQVPEPSFSIKVFTQDKDAVLNKLN